VSGYDYIEPGAPSISISGAKIGAEYLGTFLLDKPRHWYAQVGVRAVGGKATYDGWCSPWLIVPSNASPNGYALDLGDRSPCSETGDKDWYVETRGLVGRDFIGRAWAWSLYTGVGLRHLSNGIAGISGYRTDDYLYVPVGVTARTALASHRVLSVGLEYDRLVRGWQHTRDSRLGGGGVSGTPVAPPFTIDSFTDISFAQHRGWALRASAAYPLTDTWSLEPYYVHWRVGDSRVNFETATFTVNGVSAQQRLGAYEPRNLTHEAGVKFAFHF